MSEDGLMTVAKVVVGVAAAFGAFFGLSKCQEAYQERRRVVEPKRRKPIPQPGDAEYDWANPFPDSYEESETYKDPLTGEVTAVRPYDPTTGDAFSKSISENLKDFQGLCTKSATVVQSVIQVIDTFKKAFSKTEQFNPYNAAFCCPHSNGSGHYDAYEEHLRNPNKTVVGPDGAVFKWIRHNVVECYPPPNTDFGNRYKYGH